MVSHSLNKRRREPRVVARISFLLYLAVYLNKQLVRHGIVLRTFARWPVGSRRGAELIHETRVERGNIVRCSKLLRHFAHTWHECVVDEDGCLKLRDLMVPRKALLVDVALLPSTARQ